MKSILNTTIIFLLLLVSCKSSKYVEFTHNQRVEMEGGYYEVECLKTKSPYDSKVTICLFNHDNKKPIEGFFRINNIQVGELQHKSTVNIYSGIEERNKFDISALPRYPLYSQNMDYHLFRVENLVLKDRDSLVFKVYSKEYTAPLY